MNCMVELVIEADLAPAADKLTQVMCNERFNVPSPCGLLVLDLDGLFVLDATIVAIVCQY